MSRPQLGTGLSMQATQQLSMTPRMLQAIEVLQLPSGDLESWLEEQAQSNEALSLDRKVAASEYRGSIEDSHAHDEMLRSQPDRPRSLSEQIEEQLGALDLGVARLDWVRFLIGCLDERGYLSPSDEVLLVHADEAGLSGGAAALGVAIADLQGLEPLGLGARNAIEALLLQLDPGDPEYSLMCRMLEEFVEELAKNRLPQVARAMGLDLGELERLLSQLGELDPRPAAQLLDVCAPTLRPDVLVLPVEEGGFAVELSRAALPAVSVDEDLRVIARDRKLDPDVRRYARQKVDQARAVVTAVHQRGETLLRVAQRIFSHQGDYLHKGPGHLRPLSMTDLAEELGLHVSTVSRCVSGKYAQTPWGVEPLRDLFQAAAGGAASARTDVRSQVEAVFAGEDSAAPLSDDEAVAELGRHGIELARRTVAKYRRELGIPSSYRRRKF